MESNCPRNLVCAHRNPDVPLRRAEETPNVPNQLCIHRDRSVIIRSFTWSLHGPLLLACQKASAGLDGREQS